MAVTAHWLQLVQLQGGQKKITLRADLIGFVNVPENHTGQKLADIFYFIIDRMDLESKVIFSLIIEI